MACSKTAYAVFYAFKTSVGKTEHVEKSKWRNIGENWIAALIRVESSGVGHSFVLLREDSKICLLQSYVDCLSIRGWLRSGRYKDSDLVEKVLESLEGDSAFSCEDFGVQPLDYKLRDDCKVSKIMYV